MTKYWIGVASHEHVKRGTAGGFAQVCHGKGALLKKMNLGDWILYYSPTELFKGNTRCRKFTALGQVTSSEPYQVRLYDDFMPWRHDATFISITPVAIYSVIDELSFIVNKVHWGILFRRGGFQIPEADFRKIAGAMGETTDE